MLRDNIPLVRRRSGGGTVYHDPGNVNFSFHVQKDGFERRVHADLVARGLARPPVALPWRLGQAPVFLNERNDLSVFAAGATEPSDALVRKVSGSAFKMVNQRVYHHGTLLLQSSLDRMHMLKRDMRGVMTSRGVDSVPSPVANIGDVFTAQRDALTFDNIVAAIRAEFEHVYGEAEYYEVNNGMSDLRMPAGPDASVSVREVAAELQSWHWAFGTSPDFTMRVTSDSLPFAQDAQLTLQLHCHRGRVERAEIEHLSAPEDLEQVVRAACERLEGVPYDELAYAPDTGAERVAPAPVPSSDRPVRAWIREQL